MFVTLAPEFTAFSDCPSSSGPVLVKLGSDLAQTLALEYDLIWLRRLNVKFIWTPGGGMYSFLVTGSSILHVIEAAAPAVVKQCSEAERSLQEGFGIEPVRDMFQQTIMLIHYVICK